MAKFSKGKSGNSAGRPKGTGVKNLLSPELRKRINPAKLVKTLISLTEINDPAINLRAIEYIFNRLEGRIRIAEEMPDNNAVMLLSDAEVKALNKSGVIPGLIESGLLLRIGKRGNDGE